MKVSIKATNLELTEAIKQYVEDKMNMLDKYLDDIAVMNCDFEVELTSNHHNKGNIFRAEVNLDFPKELLRVEKTEEDLYKAIDKVKDHLAEMIVKYKEKLLDKERQ